MIGAPGFGVMSQLRRPPGTAFTRGYIALHCVNYSAIRGSVARAGYFVPLGILRSCSWRDQPRRQPIDRTLAKLLHLVASAG